MQIIIIDRHYLPRPLAVLTNPVAYLSYIQLWCVPSAWLSSPHLHHIQLRLHAMHQFWFISKHPLTILAFTCTYHNLSFQKGRCHVACHPLRKNCCVWSGFSGFEHPLNLLSVVCRTQIFNSWLMKQSLLLPTTYLWFITLTIQSEKLLP